MTTLINKYLKLPLNAFTVYLSMQLSLIFPKLELNKLFLERNNLTKWPPSG